MSMLSTSSQPFHIVLQHRSEVQKAVSRVIGELPQLSTCQPSTKDRSRRQIKDLGDKVNLSPQPTQSNGQLRLLESNQSIVLTVLQSLLLVTDRMNRFAQLLYEESDSLSLYRSFRHLYESFSACSMNLHKFQPNDQASERKKRQFVDNQIRLLSRVEQRVATVAQSELQDIVEENRNLRMILRKYEEQLQTLEKKPSNTTLKEYEGLSVASDVIEQNVRLREQLQQQEMLMAANNEQFSESIQKYNALLANQQMELQRLQSHLSRTTSLQTVVVQLKAELELYKEQRFKDQLLIEYSMQFYRRNMTRKLRAQQKLEQRLQHRDRTSERFDRPPITRTLSSTFVVK